MMKILHISDTHNKHKQIRFTEEELRSDVIVHSGDFTAMGRESELDNFLKWWINIPVKYKIFIAGNHDVTFDPFRGGNSGEKPEWLELSLLQYGSNKDHYYLENSGCEIEGVKFWGSPVTPWFHGEGWGFNKHRGDEIKRIWDQIPYDTDVLITHGPPAHKLDYTEIDRLYVGCEQLRYRIEEIKPNVHMFGHIHEGYGMTEDSNTVYSNGSICNLRYEAINKPNLIVYDR